MLVCFELGKTEQEVSGWALKDLYRWLAFLQLKNEAEAKAIEKAKKAR